MIVWGGYFFDGNPHFLNTGGRYNPGANIWTATSLLNVPSARTVHAAVWTGNEMIVWGGEAYDDFGTSTGGPLLRAIRSNTDTDTESYPNTYAMHRQM